MARFSGSSSIARICSEIAGPPGSRVRRTSQPFSRRYASARQSCVDFPQPSTPSNVMNFPCITPFLCIASSFGEAAALFLRMRPSFPASARQARARLILASAFIFLYYRYGNRLYAPSQLCHCCGVLGEMHKISLRIFQKRHGIAICPAYPHSASAALRGMRRLSPQRQTPAGKIFHGLRLRAALTCAPGQARFRASCWPLTLCPRQLPPMQSTMALQLCGNALPHSGLSAQPHPLPLLLKLYPASLPPTSKKQKKAAKQESFQQNGYAKNWVKPLRQA